MFNNSISKIRINPRGDKMHTMYYNEFLLQGAIFEPENKISRTTTSEFQDFSSVFQDLCLFPGLSTVCTNPELPRSTQPSILPG